MWRFICHHQSICNLDTRVLPPSSCQSVEAVPEEKYGLSKQNNLFLPQIPFLRLDVKLHHPILPSFASSDDHFLATTTFGFDIIVWRIIVSIMLTGWLVLEMQNQPVELATTFESDGAVLRNRSRHLQLAQFLPASLSHVSHKHLSHNSHDYASCDSHEYLSHKMRQTATNWPWPLSVT